MMSREQHPPLRVAILGGGFGGVAAYLGLHRRLHGRSNLSITMVSDRDAFCFVTLLHEVATGSLLPESITQSIRTLPRCCMARFVEARATVVDCDRKVVIVERVDGFRAAEECGIPLREEIPFDQCIAAVGSTTNFFDTPGASVHARTLHQLADARAIKEQIIAHFEAAEDCREPTLQAALTRFVIVGGGPTGVELAGELADYCRHECSTAFPSLARVWEILLCQSGDRLVPQVDRWFHERSLRILSEEKGVRVRFGKRVTAVDAEGVMLGDERIMTRNVFWVAGVSARPLEFRASTPVVQDERTGRIRVNEFLEIPNVPGVFVVGDQAWVADHETGQPYPMRAQFATREGDLVAANVQQFLRNEPREPFAWRDQGFLLSLGKGGALGEVYGVRVAGPFAWWLYRTAYLLKIVGWRAKLRTVLEWTLNLFFPRDLAKSSS